MLTSSGAIRAWWSLLMVLLTAVLIAGANVAYTSHVQRQADARQERARHEADRRWCALFATLDRPVPPTIKDPVQRRRSQQAQQLFHQLRADLGCVKA